MPYLPRMNECARGWIGWVGLDPDLDDDDSDGDGDLETDDARDARS